jgi:hypothetical protein
MILLKLTKLDAKKSYAMVLLIKKFETGQNCRFELPIFVPRLHIFAIHDLTNLRGSPFVYRPS